MNPRVIAIGDIHGCGVALRTLLEAIGPQGTDIIVTLGDAVDRGPDSRGVVDQLLRLRERCQLVPLLGNHEEMMINYLDHHPQPDDWLLCGGAATLASYSPKQDRFDKRDLSVVPEEHIAYIRTWGDYYETSDHFFVHASYEPQRPLAQQRWRMLRWHAIRSSPPGAHNSGKTAIVGHTSQKNGEILDLGYLKCIDTYCYGSCWLTAIDTTSGQIWQANDDGKIRTPS